MNTYQQVIERVFFDHYSPGITRVPFTRSDLETAAKTLGLNVPKNLGDVIYSFRYRAELPTSIIDKATPGREWIIQGIGPAEYAFVLAKINRITPNPAMMAIKVPDATPEIVLAHGLSDEQALLAKIRYNRLIDVFLGISAYSLQNHLRTTVDGIGQIEIDEIYVAVDTNGRQFVLPVQAKGNEDQLSAIQSMQDIMCCAQKYPSLICRPISTQLMADDRIVLFEVTMADDELYVVREKHYRLAPASEITAEDLKRYRDTAED